MPSALTHMFVGAAAAQLVPAESRRGRIALAFAVAAAIPDLDVAAFVVGIPYAHPLGHRGLSHSLLGAVAIGTIAALVATWKSGVPRQHVRRIILVGFIAVVSHGVLDAATNAGLGIGFFVPMYNERFFLPWRPIETASVNPLHFFSARGLAVLHSEVAWVWLPVTGLSLALWLGKRLLRDSSDERGQA